MVTYYSKQPLDLFTSRTFSAAQRPSELNNNAALSALARTQQWRQSLKALRWRGMEIGSQVVKDSWWGKVHGFCGSIAYNPWFFLMEGSHSQGGQTRIACKNLYTLFTTYYQTFCVQKGWTNHKWRPFVLSSVRSVMFKGMLETNHQAHGRCSWKFEFRFPLEKTTHASTFC